MRIPECLKVIRNDKMFSITFDTFQAHQGKIEHNQSTGKEDNGSNSQRAPWNLTVEFIPVDKHGYRKRSEEYDPEDRYKELEKQGRI